MDLLERQVAGLIVAAGQQHSMHHISIVTERRHSTMLQPYRIISWTKQQTLIGCGMELTMGLALTIFG